MSLKCLGSVVRGVLRLDLLLRGANLQGPGQHGEGMFTPNNCTDTYFDIGGYTISRIRDQPFSYSWIF